MTVVLILFALLIYIVYTAVIKVKQKRLNSNSNKKENTNADDMIWANDFHLYPGDDVHQSPTHYDFDGDNNIDSIDTNNHHSPH